MYRKQEQKELRGKLLVVEICSIFFLTHPNLILSLMLSISLFLRGCSKPQVFVGSAVSQTQGVQHGTMVCMGV